MVSGRSETPRTIAEAMPPVVDPAGFTVDEVRDQFIVTIALGRYTVHAFVRLASGIEARVNAGCATAMVCDAGETGVPLGLVAGPDILGKWLDWTRTAKPFAKALALTDRTGIAPVLGEFARCTRRDLDQMSVPIIVCAAQAVAERIELSKRTPAVAVSAECAVIRIAHQHLAETLLQALDNEPTGNRRSRLAQ